MVSADLVVLVSLWEVPTGVLLCWTCSLGGKTNVYRTLTGNKFLCFRAFVLAKIFLVMQ
jgi:hypothetical protein